MRQTTGTTPHGRLLLACVAAALAAALAIGCTQATPPAPTAAPAAPAKAAEPTKAPPAPTKATEPAKAPAAQPTAAAAPAPTKGVAYPEKGKAVTVIIPWAAGGGADTAGRLIASALEKELGVPFTPVNRAGAASQVGMTEAARAKPDGYTLVSISTANGILSYLDPERKAAYNRDSFALIALYASEVGALAVKGDSQYKSLKDMVDAAKANPGKLKIGTTGRASADHLRVLAFGKEAGAKFGTAHFESSPQGIAAVLGGHIDGMMAASSSFLSQQKSGEMRVLGVTGEGPVKQFPESPTFVSQGYKVLLPTTRGFGAPSGTPREIVDTLARAIKKGLEAEDVKQKMDQMALPVVYMDAAGYTAHWTELEALMRTLLPLAQEEK